MTCATAACSSALAAVVGGILAGRARRARARAGALVVGVGALGAAWFVDGAGTRRDRGRRARAARRRADRSARSTARRTRRSPTPIARRELVTAAGRARRRPAERTLRHRRARTRRRRRAAHRTLLAVATGDDALRAARARGRRPGRARPAGSRPLHPDRFDGRARWRHAIGRLDDAQVLALRPAAGGASASPTRCAALVLRGTAPLAADAACAARRLPARRHRGRCPTPSSPTTASRASRTCSRCRARTSRSRSRCSARCCAGCGLGRAHGRGDRDRAPVRDDDALRAVGAPRVGAGGRRAGARRSSGRPASSVRALALAVIALLVIDPFLLHSVGFWLSCGASAGIALLSGADPRAAAAVRRGSATRSRCRSPRRSASRRCCSRRSARCRSSRRSRTCSPRPRPKRSVSTACSRARSGGIAPPLAPVLQQPTAVADRVDHARSPAARGSPRPVGALDGSHGAAVARVGSCCAALGSLRGVPACAVPDDPHRRARLRRPHARARDGHPQPHARLVLRPRRDLGLRRVPPPGRRARRRRRRPARRRRREGRARARGRRGRGARPGRARDRGAARALRRAALGRHVARVGARRRVRRGRGRRQRHLRASPTPTTSRSRRAHDATVVATHIRLRPRVADPEPHYDDLVGEVTAFLLERARRAEAAGLDARADRARRRASTSARRPRRARCCCASRPCTPRSATRCCCRRRTSGSSASCSGARSTTGAPSRSPRSPTASRAGAASCACTTCSAACACAARSTRCSPRRVARAGGVVTITLVQGADPSLRDREVQRVDRRAARRRSTGRSRSTTTRRVAPPRRGAPTTEPDDDDDASARRVAGAARRSPRS